MEQYTYNGLPVYQLAINENNESGVSAIALVDTPAIKRNFMKFKETPQIMQHFTAYEDRHIVSGPLVIPDTLMYRDDELGKYYALFTKDMVEKVMLKFFENGNLNKVNLMHNPEKIVKDVMLFESFISDSSRGIMPLKGYEDCPEGTWFVSFKIMNDDVWKQVNEETFKGFSIEGLFGMQPHTETEEAISEDVLEEARQLRERLSEIISKI